MRGDVRIRSCAEKCLDDVETFVWSELKALEGVA